MNINSRFNTAEQWYEGYNKPRPLLNCSKVQRKSITSGNHLSCFMFSEKKKKTASVPVCVDGNLILMEPIDSDVKQFQHPATQNKSYTFKQQ